VNNRDSVGLDDVVNSFHGSVLLSVLLVSLFSSQSSVVLVEGVLDHRAGSLVGRMVLLRKTSKPFLGPVNSDLNLSFVHNSDSLVDDPDVLDNDDLGYVSHGSRVDLVLLHDLVDSMRGLLSGKLRGLSENLVDSVNDVGLFLDRNLMLPHDMHDLSDSLRLLGVFVDDLLVVSHRVLLVNDELNMSDLVVNNVSLPDNDLLVLSDMSGLFNLVHFSSVDHDLSMLSGLVGMLDMVDLSFVEHDVSNNSGSLVDVLDMRHNGNHNVLSDSLGAHIFLLQDRVDGTFGLFKAQALGLLEQPVEFANNLGTFLGPNLMLLHESSNLFDGLGFL
jgi:hypothetical protein